MAGSLCVILGGAGFIGSHVADALVENGYPVRVFDLPHRKTTNIAHFANRIEILEGDFENRTDLEHALQDAEYIFHLVGTTLPQNSNQNPIYDIESNVIGTLRLLQIAQTARVKKIIFISSGGTVYGIPETIPIPETHPTFPLNAYGISKLAIEKYLHLFYHLYGIEYVVLRVSNPYGERQQTVGAQQGVVSVFMDRIRQGQPITIWGDGSIVRDFLYVKDMAQTFLLALKHTARHRIFNVGSGTGTSINELLAMLAHITGITPQVNYTPGRAADVPCNILDTTRIRAEWGWSATTSMETGLAQTWEWVRQRET
jgi:UDP-glucose 4-epimerase